MVMYCYLNLANLSLYTLGVAVTPKLHGGEVLRLLSSTISNDFHYTRLVDLGTSVLRVL